MSHNNSYHPEVPLTAPLHSNEQIFTTLDKRLYMDVPEANPHRPVEAFPQGAVLSLAVDYGSATMTFSMNQGLVLGRKTPETVGQMVDLNPIGAYKHGVSREHAMIWRAPDSYLLIKDLRSTNGTYIDGQRLHPFKHYLLDNGDRLQLGELFLRVSYLVTHAPASDG